MLKTKLIVRPGATAIAAVLAMSTTPIWAQDVTTAVDVPAAEAAPVDEAAPAARTESVTTTTVTETTSSADAAPVVEKKTTSRTVTRAPAKAPARSAAKAAAPLTAAPLAASPAAPAETAVEPIPAAPVTIEPEPSAASPAEPESALSPIDGETAQYAFGGALAALILGGAALAATRRRRRADELDEAHGVPPAAQPSVIDRQPMAQPAIAGRSAFAWGIPTAAAQPASRLTPTAQAKIGPTPENPYMSLKKRMKRAAFFEDRERQAAAGRAVPVPRSAGLPKRAVDLLRQGMAMTSPRPAFQPA